MHLVKRKHPIPITYILRNNLHVKLELHCISLILCRSAYIILLLMYTSLKATEMMQQTNHCKFTDM